MFEKEKRKNTPQNRMFIGLAAWLMLMFIASLMILAAVVTGIIKRPLSEWEMFATGDAIMFTQEAESRARVEALIQQTIIASTQIYLSTTSPTAMTPTPTP